MAGEITFFGGDLYRINNNDVKQKGLQKPDSKNP
jgi:hypothetical protein|tara:strand:+ start:1305 stop:1406 length:102 start_codon:yes stop_codon:yes gene_type:complete